MTWAYLGNPLILDAVARAADADHQNAATTPAGGLLPDEVRAFLAQLRLLVGVPFSHLVADPDLLPMESIRFFYLDREWTDALVEGALSVGTMTTLDRRHLAALYRPIRDEVDGEERRLRATEETRPGFGPANTITGFLLRSAAVSGWPGLHVRGYSVEVGDTEVLPDNDPRRLRLVRLERLAPAVLLAMFDGVPQVVHVEEPRQGIQFGVDLNATGANFRLRDANSGADVGTAAVAFRKDSPGVLDMRALAQRVLDNRAVTHVDSHGLAECSSAELALQLLQFPYRQIFGRVTVRFADLFSPTVSVQRLENP